MCLPLLLPPRAVTDTRGRLAGLSSSPAEPQVQLGASWQVWLVRSPSFSPFCNKLFSKGQNGAVQWQVRRGHGWGGREEEGYLSCVHKGCNSPKPRLGCVHVPLPGITHFTGQLLMQGKLGAHLSTGPHTQGLALTLGCHKGNNSN